LISKEVRDKDSFQQTYSTKTNGALQRDTYKLLWAIYKDQLTRYKEQRNALQDLQKVMGLTVDKLSTKTFSTS